MNNYIGALYINLLDSKRGNSIYIISDNKDIDISFKITNKEADFSKYGNLQTKALYDYKKNQSVDYKKYDFLNYYIPTSEISNNEKNIINHFANAGNYFETSGLEGQLLYSYFRLYYIGNTNTEVKRNLKKGIDKILDEVGEDTYRGQEILSGIIKLLKAYSLTELTNHYFEHIKSFDCEISEGLKQMMKNSNQIAVGQKIPNISFKPSINNKYKDLYSIDSSMKLILVWASWCGACKREMPQLKQFYESFKKQKGEIIALSIDTNKEDWLAEAKDMNWLNYSELLGWDSSFVKDLDISSSPTMILLDKNNKILKITFKISEINNIIK